MHLKLLQKEQLKKQQKQSVIRFVKKMLLKIQKNQPPQNTSEALESETEIPRKRYTSPDEKQQIINELRLI